MFLCFNDLYLWVSFYCFYTGCSSGFQLQLPWQQMWMFVMLKTRKTRPDPEPCRVQVQGPDFWIKPNKSRTWLFNAEGNLSPVSLTGTWCVGTARGVRATFLPLLLRSSEPDDDDDDDGGGGRRVSGDRAVLKNRRTALVTFQTQRLPPRLSQ